MASREITQRSSTLNNSSSSASAVAVVGKAGRLSGLEEKAELFDAAFFDLSARDASGMAPQHRIFLEHAYQALEDAGYSSQPCKGRVGIFGASNTDAVSLASRVSSKLGLTGPNLMVQASALAVHLAVRSLLWGDVDMVLAGGVAMRDSQGREGVGIVVLKRLEDALADGDAVRAVIRSSLIHGDCPPDAATGVARLLEAVLALEDRTAPLQSTSVDCSGVSLILEEATEQPRQPSPYWQLLLLSARTRTALEMATVELAGFLRRHPEADLGDVAHTLQSGRRSFEHRRALVCRDGEDALAVLEGRAVGRLETFAGGGRERRVSFLLPGFGDHYPDMALGLYRTEPTFRRAVDHCSAHLLPELGFDLRSELFPGLAGADSETQAVAPSKLDLRSILRGEKGGAGNRSSRMVVVHPAVFVVEYALARLLMSWGIRPRAMIGYSLGEYTAACLAGVLSLEDCLTLIARRARLIEELPAGAMLAVPLPATEIEPRLRDGLGIAVVNGPSLHIVSGPLSSVEDLEAELAAAGVVCRRLSSDHAGHSPLMEAIAPRLRELLSSFELRPPQIPYVSNVTGTWIQPEEATDPDYWVRHLCGRVLFGEGLGRLLELDSVLLEVGPGQSLTSFAKQHPASDASRASLMFSTLRSAYNVQPDRAFLLSALGRLWMAGVSIDWEQVLAGRQRIPLPTYPFEHRRLWLEPGNKARPQTSSMDSGRVHTWPNGMRIVHQSRTEAEHFYQDIFEKRVYHRHGIEFPDGACIFDVGANIGSFMLYASQACRGAQIYSFEPAPPLFEKLRLNAMLNGVEAHLFNFGISDREGLASFTFYPRSSGMSSFHADKEQEKDILRLMMERERDAGVEGVGELMGFAEDLLEGRFKSETFQCRLRPLSDVIAEYGVEWIDLLKIDVQKAELEVLRGIRDGHWPRIGQVVLEVHDLDRRLDKVLRLLEERGFQVVVEQDELLRGSVLYNLFAVRERGHARPVMGIEYAVASNELERGIVEIWQQILEVEHLGIDDNFFDLGGTSLLGLRIAQEIKSRLGMDLSPVVVFEAPTVRTLARYLDSLRLSSSAIF